MTRDYIAEALAINEAQKILKDCRIKVYEEAGNCCSKVWLFLDHASKHLQQREVIDSAFDAIMEPIAEFERRTRG